MQTELELYYNKFNEEKLLDRRHGRVEFVTSLKYIHKYLDEIARMVSIHVTANGLTLSHSEAA